MRLKIGFVIVFFVIFSNKHIAQESLPVYLDYLTDNYYLLHPSMAGASRCSKVRLTARQQWFGQEDAPKLLTLNANGRIGDTPSGVGAIFYTDQNGYHSQTGAYLTYAYHIMFSRNEIDLDMLSFGLNVGVLQYKLDQTSFLADGFDPIVNGVEESATNFNVDAGFSYHKFNYFAHVTVKNILKNSGINNDIEISSNLRRYLISIGGVFSKYRSTWSIEPSIMYHYREGTKESSIDVNLKGYKKTDFGKLWGGVSYRRSFDGAEFLDGSGVSSQKLQYVTPFLGLDYKDFMAAYTYSFQSNSLVFNNGGFHQVTLGYNFNCRKEQYDCNCPSVN